jgi:hypothetical protein
LRRIDGHGGIGRLGDGCRLRHGCGY